MQREVRFWKVLLPLALVDVGLAGVCFWLAEMNWQDEYRDTWAEIILLGSLGLMAVTAAVGMLRRKRWAYLTSFGFAGLLWLVAIAQWYAFLSGNEFEPASPRAIWIAIWTTLTGTVVFGLLFTRLCKRAFDLVWRDEKGRVVPFPR